MDEDGIIIEGHGRYQALKELGYQTAEVIVLRDMNEEQKKAYRLVHNQLTMNSGLDLDLLKEELSGIADIDMQFYDFNVIDDPEGKEDDFDQDAALDDASARTYVKQGEVYRLGNHYLMCGDSTKEDDVRKLMADYDGNPMDQVQADLLLTDPPYNVDYGRKGKQYKERGGYGCGMDDRSIENDNMDEGVFLEFLKDAFKAADSVMKDGCPFYIWHSDSHGFTFRSACNEVEWDVRQCIIWNKDSLVLGRQDYQWKHEPALYGWKHDPALYGWKKGAAHYFAPIRTNTTVLDFPRPKKSDLHPTMKPIPLFAKLVSNSSKPGEIVLDPFGGSGTTLIACEQLGRRCRIMELDPKYAQVIIKRWEDLTGKEAERIA